jgi:hypothetical protein
MRMACKVAAEMRPNYRAALPRHASLIRRNIRENLIERRLRSRFGAAGCAVLGIRKSD